MTIYKRYLETVRDTEHVFITAIWTITESRSNYPFRRDVSEWTPKRIVDPLVRFAGERKHLAGESVCRGKHRKVSVPVEDNNATIRERLVDSLR